MPLRTINGLYVCIECYIVWLKMKIKNEYNDYQITYLLMESELPKMENEYPFSFVIWILGKSRFHLYWYLISFIPYLVSFTLHLIIHDNGLQFVSLLCILTQSNELTMFHELHVTQWYLKTEGQHDFSPTYNVKNNVNCDMSFGQSLPLVFHESACLLVFTNALV